MLWLYRLLVGSVFVFAGESKLYDSAVGYTSSRLTVFGVDVMPWLGTAEVLLGLLVFSGVAPHTTRLAVIAILCSFLSYSSATWLVGSARCSCFGALPVTPGHAFVLDVALLALTMASLLTHPRKIAPFLADQPQASVNPGQTLAALLAIILLPSTVLAQADRSSAAPGWRERFLQEYPAAQQRLRKAVSQAEGEGRYLRSGDPPNKKAKSRDEMKWGAFRFFTRDDALRLDLTLAGGGTEPNVGMVLSPGFNFRVLSPNTQSAQMAQVSKDVSGKLLTTHALYWRDFFAACYAFAEAPLVEWMKRPGFRLEEVDPAPDADGKELVRVTFRWDGAEWFKNLPSIPEDYEFTGEWLLSPEEDWAIRRTEYRQSYPYENEKDGKRERSLESETGLVDVQHVEDLGFVPRRVELTLSRSTSDWSALREVDLKICEFQNVRRSSAGDEVFTPESLGAPDPRGISWWLIGVNAGVLLLLLAAWFGWRAWRRQ
jgi:uncharacterized membrane protein YphA (DoxX/SURF4 family)